MEFPFYLSDGIKKYTHTDLHTYIQIIICSLTHIFSLKYWICKKSCLQKNLLP